MALLVLDQKIPGSISDGTNLVKNNTSLSRRSAPVLISLFIEDFLVGDQAISKLFLLPICEYLDISSYFSLPLNLKENFRNISVARTVYSLPLH